VNLHDPGGVGGGGTHVDIQLNVFRVTRLPVQPFQQYDVRVSYLWSCICSNMLTGWCVTPSRRALRARCLTLITSTVITKANATADDSELPARRKQDIIDKLQNDRADIFTSRAAFDGNV
jgi:hypothetical protein